MKNKLVLLLFICCGMQMATAQEKSTSGNADKARSMIAQDRQALVQEFTEQKTKGRIDTAALLSAADVGEPDSFGKNALFLGTATTGIIYVYHSCDPAVLLAELELTLAAEDRCLASPIPGQTVSATFENIGRINIPRNSVDNVIYFIQNNLVSYDLSNPNATRVFSNFSYSPTYTIESDALNDPAAIDPNTGLPMNGSFTTGVGGSKIFTRTYEANAFETVSERFSTAATRGFARSYFADLGLPQNVINRLYRRPMTIKLNLRIRGNYFTFGQFGYSVRFLGN